MKLSDALTILRDVPADTEPVVIYLACGFTPLHFKTLLAAEIWQVSHKNTEIQIGLYGDLLGSLQKAGESGPDFVVCVAEWSDLDPRLGLRSLGGWSPELFPDIVETTSRRMTELQRSIEEVSARVPVLLSTPTLPLPPISFTSKEQAGSLDLELRACVATSAARLARLPNVRLLNITELDRLSIAGERLDAKSELFAGFPYSLQHAGAMAAMFARLISDLAPKKGLITDLDDTLWKGIVGEVGVDGIGWTLDRQAQIHGLYQQLLAALAAAGVLIAAASKNDPKVVDAVFARQDLVMTKDDLFPIEANWEAKSRSVARILRTWNISADSVVFVDDSAAELAEVAHAHPGITCCQFPARDSQAAYRLLEQLRDAFGKGRLLDEDRLRASSVRQSRGPTDSLPLPSGEDFLARANPELTAEYCDTVVDPRALELINKTNQFNLNGKRHTLASLSRLLQSPGGFIMVVSYRDKYGPLGKIATLCGSSLDDAVYIDTWVMSCRAFCRRIEYWCVSELFRRFAVSCISFDFQATERNGPLQAFLTSVLGGPPFTGCKLARDYFLTRLSRPPKILMETTHA